MPMKLSNKTLRAAADIITGNPLLAGGNPVAPYRTLGDITGFFRDFGERDIHPASGAPSRFSYTLEKLEKFNNSPLVGKVVCVALQFWERSPEYKPENAAAYLNKFLIQDGYKLEVEHGMSRMNGDSVEYFNPYFELRSLRANVIETASLISLSHESINEHISKARRKIEAGDAAGAIVNAYTLVEEFLKELLRKTDTEFKESEGDIRTLYKAIAKQLGLEPKGEALESYLKTILEGLQRQIGGLYEVANKASDRHARKYTPAKHHAKLAVNASFTLCEFLLESYEYQMAREAKNLSTPS